MLSSAIHSAIEDAVRATLSPLAITGVLVEEGEDYDANDILLVTVNLPLEVGQIPGEMMLHTMGAVSEAVLKLGDQRPPHLRTMRDGEPIPDDGSDRSQ